MTWCIEFLEEAEKDIKKPLKEGKNMIYKTLFGNALTFINSNINLDLNPTLGAII